MKDSSKTKQEFIEEISILKQKIKKLEKSEATHKQAEEALKESELRNRAIVAALPDLLFQIAADGHFLACQASNQEPLLFSPDQVIGKQVAEILPPDLAHLTMRKVRETLDSGQLQIFEYSLIVKDQERYYEARMTGIGDSSILALVREITLRKRAEQALKESEERYRGIIENMLDAYYRSDRDGRLIMVSSSGLDLLGYDSIAELIGTSISDAFYFNPEERDRLLLVLRERGFIKDYEVTLKHKDGTPIPVSTSSRYYSNDKGEILGVEGIFRDLRARKLAEEALNHSEEKYRQLVDNINEGICVVQDGIMKFVNPMCLKVIGYSAHDLTTKPFIEFIHPDDRDMVLERHMRRLRGEKLPTQYEFRIVTCDGITKWVEIDSVMNQWEGKPAALAFIRDITERKCAEDALQESETKLQAIFDTVGTGILIIDKDTQIILETNPIAVEMTGLPKEKIIGQICHSLVCPAQAGKCPVKDLGQSVDHSERKLLCAHGHLKDILKTVYPITIKGRDCYIESFVDISDRKRAEEALRESEQFLRETQSIASIGGWKANPETDFLQWTEGVYHMVEAPLDYHPGLREGMKYYTPETIQILRERILNTLTTNEPFMEECEIITTSGKKLWTEVRGLSHVMEGRTPCVIGTIQNITERKNAEKALRESEELFRVSMERAPDGVYMNDLEGNFLYGNRKAEEIMGYRREELMGRNYLDLNIAEGSLNKAVELHKGNNEGRSAGPYELELIRKDGRHILTEINTTVVKQRGQINILGFVRDITERKLAEEERRSLTERLQRAEKMEALGQLAGGVAHDLNNVLGVLSGYSELLLMEIPEGSRSRGHVEKILKSTQKGAAIIEDLLTLARRGVTVSDVINLNNVVSDFLKAPVLEKMKDYYTRVTFSAKCDNNLLNIKGSPLHLEKTLMNLVSNAAESIS